MHGNMTDMVLQGSGSDRGEQAIDQSNIMSREEYIAQLEAEVRSLKGENAKGSSTQVLLRSESTMRRRRDENDGRAVSY